MLYPLFIQILNMSVIAVPMIITVMLFRLFVNRVPHTRTGYVPLGR